ncbi:hypothetical protein FXO37_05018 [Capsicum annuum]|nr:hypothetical protein FXO37_05018 [Capsicum annuum]
MLVDLAVFSAEATATEATAMATSKALSLTNRSTIALPYAWLNNIEATFWGDFVEQITPYLDGSNTAPIVVIIQFIRAHKFQGSRSNKDHKEVFCLIERTGRQVKLDTILDKNALFKVAVKSHNVEQHVEVYTILKICDDEKLTKQFQPSCSDNDFSDSNPDNNLNTPTNTLTKRSLLEVESLGTEVEDNSNAQLSSTKLNKVVKKEKRA